MKWIKCQKGNLYRLGAIKYFSHKDLYILMDIGEDDCFILGEYTNKIQLEEVISDLERFIEDTKEAIFAFPKKDDNSWLRRYDISEIASDRELNALHRANVNTIYDLFPQKDGWKKAVRGIGKDNMEKLIERCNEYIKRLNEDDDE